MNVWIVVTSRDWQSGYHIMGVYDDKMKAIAVILKMGGILNEEYLAKLDIELWDVDGEEYGIEKEYVA